MGAACHCHKSSPTADTALVEPAVRDTAVDAATEDTADRAQARFLENKDWLHRMNEIFTHVDVDKDGYITLADWEVWVDNIREQISSDDNLVDKLRQSVREFCGKNGIGLIEGEKVGREKFVNNLMVAFSMREGRKKIEDTLLHRVNNDWFNVVDPTNDGSSVTVTLDGYRKVMKACNFGEKVAEDTFKHLSGKDGDIPGDFEVNRNELIKMEFNFWFTPGDEESKGLYGPQSEFERVPQ